MITEAQGIILYAIATGLSTDAKTLVDDGIEREVIDQLIHRAYVLEHDSKLVLREAGEEALRKWVIEGGNGLPMPKGLAKLN